MILVLGGSGSGKSVYAEQIAQKLQPEEKWFIATLFPFDEESQERIEQRRRRRSGQGFRTIECYTNLQSLMPCEGKTIVVDCISNLVTNEMYMEGGANVQAVGRILSDVEKLKNHCADLIVVTSVIFCDGVEYDYEMERYIHYLGEINYGLAEMADTVIEVVCGYPVVHKGKDPLSLSI